MNLSVILPFYEQLIPALTCLNSLMAMSTQASEYLVQDDCSPSANAPMLISPLVARVERNERNLGFAGNCNAGAARAHGDVLFFVNQDVLAMPQISAAWDRFLVNVFEDPAVGIVGPKLLFPDGSIQSAGGMFDGHCQPFHRCLGYRDAMYQEVNTPMQVGWVTGAALAIRRSLFEKLGGFDTAYGRGYFEDVDLCCKAQVAGFKVWYEPRCTLFHSVGSSGGNPDFMRNAQLFKSRWVDTGHIEPDTSAVKERWW